MTTTWNPSDKAANITLSGADLVATFTNNAGTGIVRTVHSIGTSEKKYWEVAVTNTVSSNGYGLGFANASASTGNWLGENNNSLAYFIDGLWYRNGSTGALPVYVEGDRVCFAVDRANSRFWARVNNGDWNDDPSANPATNTGGITITNPSGALYPAFGGDYNTNAATLHAATASWSYAAPSGFTEINASAGTNVALTGQSLALSQGAFGKTIARVLAGQALALGQGSLSPSAPVNVALTGQGLTLAQGSVGVSAAVTLVGQSLTAAQGALGPAASVALTGQSATFGQGDLTASAGSSTSVNLTGQGLNLSQGSVGVAAAIALTGQPATLSQGSLAPGLSKGLTGQALTTALGSLGKTLAITPTGQGLTLVPGALTPSATGQSVSVALVGLSLALSQATFSFSGSWTPVTGDTDTWTQQTGDTDIWTPQAGSSGVWN